jgi:hypothetical protein
LEGRKERRKERRKEIDGKWEEGRKRLLLLFIKITSISTILISIYFFPAFGVIFLF